MGTLLFNNPALFCNNLPLSLNKRALLGGKGFFIYDDVD